MSSCKFVDHSSASASPRRRTSIAARLRSSSPQHVLQFGELARAVALGDLGIDRLRDRRDRLDQLQSLWRDRHHAAAQIGLRRSGARSDRAPRDRAGCATGSAPAGRRRAPVPSPRWCRPPSARAGCAIAVRSGRDCASDGRNCRITASRARSSDIGSERENSRIGTRALPALLGPTRSVRRFLACHRQWSAMNRRLRERIKFCAATSTKSSLRRYT